MTVTLVADAFILEKPKQPLARRQLELPEPGPAEVVIEVEACGLCHTDLAFADGSVAPRHPLPLVLGHEIVGTIRGGGDAFRDRVGQRVLVPAVLPCGECDFCWAGRGNACPAQKMPGNDVHGGFATALVVPGAPLVALDDLPPGFAFDSLSVVADAVSTAFQAVHRSGLGEGDVAFVIGAGGVGGFTAQIARALGARVVACDVDTARAESLGADLAVNVRDRDPRDLKKQVHGAAREWGVPSFGWRIFECSGTPRGQELAYALLAPAATLGFVGYTREPVSVRLSNLMAFDASVFGSWGCPPAAYRDVLALIFAGKVAIEPFIERGPMSRLNEFLEALAQHRLPKRMVLDPRA
jgi:6-hydroxycyclohex-1-ene-1-carbonyl-CoA dehydrogenase